MLQIILVGEMDNDFNLVVKERVNTLDLAKPHPKSKNVSAAAIGTSNLLISRLVKGKRRRKRREPLHRQFMCSLRECKVE